MTILLNRNRRLASMSLTIVMAICSTSIAQQSEVSTSEKLKRWGHSGIRRDQLIDSSQFTVEDIRIIAENLSFKNYDKRWEQQGYYLMQRIVARSTKMDLRKAVVDALVKRVQDSDDLKIFAFDFGGDCITQDFSPDAKAYILRYLPDSGKVSKYLIDLIGVANLKEALPFLNQVEAVEGQEMGGDPLHPGPHTWTDKFSKTLSWRCLLVRARWGDEAAMDEVLELIDSIPTEEKRMETALVSLYFTGQRKAVEYLKQFLYSDTEVDEGKGHGTIPCGQQILWPLFIMIPEFPIQEGLDACRKWMTEHANDYQITVRSSGLAGRQNQELMEKECEKQQKTPPVQPK